LIEPNNGEGLAGRVVDFNDNGIEHRSGRGRFETDVRLQEERLTTWSFFMPITESSGPVIPTSVINASPLRNRSSAVCTCVCVPSTALTFPSTCCAKAFFRWSPRVKIHDNTARGGGEPVDGVHSRTKRAVELFLEIRAPHETYNAELSSIRQGEKRGPRSDIARRHVVGPEKERIGGKILERIGACQGVVAAGYDMDADLWSFLKDCA